MSLIVIDLTPMLPGGANGGAKIMTLQLIQHLAKLAPDIQFALITPRRNTHELFSAFNQLPNVVISVEDSPLASFSLSKSILSLIIKIAVTLLPSFLKTSLKKWLKRFLFERKKRTQHHFFTKTHAIYAKPDLLFCPFTAPFFHNANTPTVSVVYDLQSHYYPSFFTQDEQIERKMHFDAACKLSDKLICISHFVKQTIIDNSQLSPENIVPIHIKTAHRLHSVPLSKLNETLKSHRLDKENFLLYPANFWAHKNHTLLLVAFAAYRAKNPQSTLKLVCTGADHPNKARLQDAIKKMGLAEWVVFPGYLSDMEFSALMKGCLALIFPSLYEGFGLPVLEAMAAGKPVLCSNVTSLPEIAGDAALLFDPRKPEEIVRAIERIEHEPELVSQLIERGQIRSAKFSNEEEMAKQYLEVFRQVMKSEKPTEALASHDTNHKSLPSISVITPSYNQGQFIERTIQSVLSQNIPNLEYFVADGGSTDNTPQLLKQYTHQIRWISESDRGQAHAVNKGILETSGEIIGWLNSDDIYHDGAIKTVLRFFADHPEIDVVYGQGYHLDAHDQFIDFYYTAPWNVERLKEVCYLCQPAVFFRRNVIQQYGLLNENLQYCMDYEYWLRLAHHGARFAYIPQLLAGSRLYAETKTLGSRIKVHQEINDMMRQIFKRVPDCWLSNYTHVLVESRYEKSEPLSRQFKKNIAIQAIQASFHWNKGISPTLLTLSLSWFIQSIFSKNKVTA